MPGLLDRRLIFVTGKGGVGKSTVATALGLHAARSGRRTIVAELASQERVRRTFSQTGETFEEVELADGLYTISIDPESAMEEYLRVKTGALGQALGASRLFQAFAMATPGMRELLSVGDNLHRALASAGPSQDEAQSKLLEGVAATERDYFGVSSSPRRCSSSSRRSWHRP